MLVVHLQMLFPFGTPMYSWLKERSKGPYITLHQVKIAIGISFLENQAKTICPFHWTWKRGVHKAANLDFFVIWCWVKSYKLCINSLCSRLKWQNMGLHTHKFVDRPPYQQECMKGPSIAMVWFFCLFSATSFYSGGWNFNGGGGAVQEDLLLS